MLLIPETIFLFILWNYPERPIKKKIKKRKKRKKAIQGNRNVLYPRDYKMEHMRENEFIFEFATVILKVKFYIYKDCHILEKGFNEL